MSCYCDRIGCRQTITTSQNFPKTSQTVVYLESSFSVSTALAHGARSHIRAVFPDRQANSTWVTSTLLCTPGPGLLDAHQTLIYFYPGLQTACCGRGCLSVCKHALIWLAVWVVQFLRETLAVNMLKCGTAQMALWVSASAALVQNKVMSWRTSCVMQAALANILFYCEYLRSVLWKKGAQKLQ